MKHRHALTISAALSLAGCGEVGLELRVTAPSGVDAGQFALEATVYRVGAGDAIDCDSVAFGDVAPGDLALVRTIPLSPDRGSLGDLPRVGTKILVVDAVSADGRVAYSGCGAVERLSDGTKLEIALEPTVELEMTPPDQLSAVIGGEPTAVTPQLVITARDYADRPLGAIPIRIRIQASDGELLDEAISTTGPAGTLAHTALVDTFGPFTLEVKARNQLTRALTRAGIGVPEPSRLDPFSGESMRWVRMETCDNALCFVGLTQALVNPDLILAELLPGGDFERTTQTDSQLTAVYLGRGAGADGATEFYIRESTGIVVLSTGATSRTIPFPPDPFDGSKVNSIYPIGPCADGELAPPQLVAMTAPAFSPTRNIALMLGDDFGTDFTIDGRFNPRGSWCLSDESGVGRRVMVGQAFDDFDARMRVLDFGSGVTGLTSAPQPLRSEDVPLVFYAERSVFADGCERVLVAYARDGEVVLDAYRLLSADRVAVLGDPIRLGRLPSAPQSMFITSLTKPDVDELVALLLAQTGAFTTPSSSLHMVTAPDDDSFANPVSFTLEDCVGQAECTLRVVDLDGDGLSEVYVATTKPVDGNFSARAYRFTR